MVFKCFDDIFNCTTIWKFGNKLSCIRKTQFVSMFTIPLKYWININPWIRVKCNKPAEINTITFTNKLISNWKILSNWKKSHIFFVGANLLISTTKGIMKATLLNRISIVSRLQHCQMHQPENLGLYSLRRRRLTGIGIPIINLRRSDDRLRFMMGIHILIRRRLFSE